MYYVFRQRKNGGLEFNLRYESEFYSLCKKWPTLPSDSTLSRCLTGEQIYWGLSTWSSVRSARDCSQSSEHTWSPTAIRTCPQYRRWNRGLRSRFVRDFLSLDPSYKWSWHGAAAAWGSIPVGNGVIYRASRPSQGTVNGGAISKWPCCRWDVKGQVS